MSYKLQSYIVNQIGENCYILSSGNEAAIIDCGCFDESTWADVRDYLTRERLTPKLALQTHMHFDHVFGLGFLEKEYHLKPQCHKLDEMIYQQMTSMARDFMGITPPLPLPAVEHFFKDGETLQLGELTIEVIHTPGHTPGGCCFYIASENLLLSGDTLFQCSIGRTDFPGGSFEMIIQSIRERLFSLPDETVVYPGHGPHTTIGFEKKHNMYL